ncbi:MAG: cation:proton antiporter [Lachnospiraceae bacterium]|nr:cation:proton antiporter [Lachnospiraceae bacterium]
MINHTLLAVAVMIFSGMACGRLVKQIKLPNVTGYLIAGLLIGPSVLNLISAEAIEGFTVVSNAALGFIAFSIGNEFKISYFKKVGPAPIIIAVFESLFAVVFVALGLLLTGHDLPFSLCLGAIAAATAPAATIMVIKQYKAKGPMTETLLSVVAIDDATALIYFSICVAIANAMGGNGVDLKSLLLDPAIEIFGALLAGAVFGAIFTFPLRYFKKPGNRLALIIGFVFAGVALAEMLGMSSLLFCMAMGAVFCNLSSNTDIKIINTITDGFTPPLFMLFFVTSGAELKLSVLPTIGVAGVIYVLLRVCGKLFGSWLAARISKASKAVQNYLGFALVPQAGVAIGLSLVAQTAVPQFGETIRAVILCATLIYELVGPAISKFALTKAGDIKETPRATKPAH